jgi:hypothetical protein
MSGNKLPHAVLVAAVQAYITSGLSQAQSARALGIPVTTLQSRLGQARLAGILVPDKQQPQTYIAQRVAIPGCINLELPDGVAVVFSDAHYWPGIISTAHRALLLFIEQLRPHIVICNGDIFDGSTISRFPRIGWDDKPTVKQEIEAVQSRMAEIEERTKGARRLHLLGNHDSRYETFLAARAPEYQGMPGFSLKDLIPLWEPGWSACINRDAYIPVEVKHRWKGGTHATHTNTLNAGTHYVTGHLHSGKVTPFTDLRGTRFGVDTGTLADPNGPQFLDYTEDSPKNHRSGFVVLTFKNRRLLWPEFVHVVDEAAGIVEFRGEEIEV